MRNIKKAWQNLSKRQANLILIALILIIFFSLLLVTKLAKRHIRLTPVKEAAVSVDAMLATPGNYQPHLTLYGRIDAAQAVTLEAQVNAEVTQVYVKDGEVIKKGQRLIKLDDEAYRLQLTQAQAAIAKINANLAIEQQRYQHEQSNLQHEQKLLNLAQKDQQRFQQLLKHKAIADSQYELSITKTKRLQIALDKRLLSLNNYQHKLKSLQASLNESKANKRMAMRAIERCNIVAPFAGKVVSVFTNRASFVHSNEKLVRLFETDAAEIRAAVPDKYLSQFKHVLKHQQSLHAHTELDGQTLTLTLRSLTAAVAHRGAGLQAIFSIKNPSVWLEMNRHVTINVTLPMVKNAIAIPSSALFYGDSIYLIHYNRLQQKQVRIKGYLVTEHQARYLIANDGIKPHTEILTTHLPNAINGLLVVAEVK